MFFCLKEMLEWFFIFSDSKMCAQNNSKATRVEKEEQVEQAEQLNRQKSRPLFSSLSTFYTPSSPLFWLFPQSF